MTEAHCSQSFAKNKTIILVGNFYAYAVMIALPDTIMQKSSLRLLKADLK
ncbi:MAG: hypothetical protein ACYC5F_00255 [Thermoleophilia bacterium]